MTFWDILKQIRAIGILSTSTVFGGNFGQKWGNFL